jgi:hypothetical protein
LQVTFRRGILRLTYVSCLRVFSEARRRTETKILTNRIKKVTLMSFGLVPLLLVAPDAAQSKRAECTSMCHLFDAYALAKVCPNLTLTRQYNDDLKVLFGGEPAVTRFKAEAISGVMARIAKAMNVCVPACLTLDTPDGTACQYLKARPTVPDTD